MSEKDKYHLIEALDSDEFNQKVNEKHREGYVLKEYRVFEKDGYVTHCALMIIDHSTVFKDAEQDELDLGLEEDWVWGEPQEEPEGDTEFKIDDFVDIIGNVTEILDPAFRTSQGEKVKVTNVLVELDTGQIVKVAFWRDKNALASGLHVSDRVHVINIKVRPLFEGMIQLNSTKNTDLVVLRRG